MLSWTNLGGLRLDLACTILLAVTPSSQGSSIKHTGTGEGTVNFSHIVGVVIVVVSVSMSELIERNGPRMVDVGGFFW